MSNWIKTNLHSAANLVRSNVLPFVCSTKYIATADVDNFKLNPSEEVTFSNRPLRADVQLELGDVLQAKMKDTNKPVLVNQDMAGWIASTGFARFKPKLSGNSPSYIYHFLSSPEGQKYVEFITTSRQYLPKALLPDIKHDEELHLSTAELTVFRRWLGIRYNRSAFPDQFDSRLKNNDIDKKIAKALRKHGEFITVIFFDVDDGVEVNRVDSEDTYQLDISILYSTEVDPLTAEAAAVEAKDAIIKIFTKKLFNNTTKLWSDIELRYCDAFSDEVFSYRQSVTYKQWRLEHISFSEEPPHEVMQYQ